MYSFDRMLHQWNLSKRRPTGFEALSINFAISQIASGMLGTFGVLYIYSLGKDLLTGLSWILMFFGLQRLVVIICSPMVAKGIARIGYRWMMVWGLLSLAAKSWLMMMVDSYGWWLLVPALILGGFSIAGYYLGYHGIFLDDNDDEKIGEQAGLVTMAGRLALMVSPFLAGFLVQGYGFGAMFGVATGLLLISLGPLFLMPHHKHQRSDFKMKQVFKLLKKKQGFSPEVVWWHLENGIQAFFWPVLLFILIGSYSNFGLVNGAVMLISSLAVFYAGKIYDKRPLRRGRWLATGLVSVSDLLRFVAPSGLMAIGADSFNRLVSPFWWMKIRRRSLLAGEKVKAMVFAVAWEWAVSTGYLASLVVGYCLLRFSNGQWPWLVVPAIIGIVWGSKNVEER